MSNSTKNTVFLDLIQLTMNFAKGRPPRFDTFRLTAHARKILWRDKRTKILVPVPLAREKCAIIGPNKKRTTRAFDIDREIEKHALFYLL